VSNRENVKAEY